MKKIYFSLACLLLLKVFVVAQSTDEVAIRNVLQSQSQSWNKGNIEAFMSGYWKNDSLMFIGKNGITYGWQNTLNNYRKGYPDATAMGQLDFEIMEVKHLSESYFFVTGKWHLARSAGDLKGAFTLLFKKINNEWVIVKDHSS